MDNRDMADWLLSNKKELLSMIDQYVIDFINEYEDRSNPFKETKYINDLRDYIVLELKDAASFLMEDKINWEELSLMFDDDKVRHIIKIEFVRQYLYN